MSAKARSLAIVALSVLLGMSAMLKKVEATNRTKIIMGFDGCPTSAAPRPCWAAQY